MHTHQPSTTSRDPIAKSDWLALARQHCLNIQLEPDKYRALPLEIRADIAKSLLAMQGVIEALLRRSPFDAVAKQLYYDHKACGQSIALLEVWH